MEPSVSGARDKAFVRALGSPSDCDGVLVAVQRDAAFGEKDVGARRLLCGEPEHH